MLFYSGYAGWGVLDSLYFATVTFTTVGYGDIAPGWAAPLWMGVARGSLELKETLGRAVQPSGLFPDPPLPLNEFFSPLPLGDSNASQK